MTATDWTAYFDAFAPRYERAAYGGAGLAALGERELVTVRAALAGRAPGRVLDAGAGTGRVARMLHALGWQVTALDASTEMLARLGATVPRVHARLGAALPFPDAAFDAVVSLRVLKYVAQLDAGVGELARVLRPGGVAVLEIANRRSLARFGYRGTSVRCASVGETAALMRAHGLAPVSRHAGARLPHAFWARATSARAAAAVASCDRAAAAILGGDTRAIGARSVILVGERS